MNEDPPKRRLLGWRQYLETLMEKGGLYSFALVFTGVGALCALIAIGFTSVNLVVSGCLGLVSLGAIWYAITLFKEGTQIGPVAPMTRHNVDLLPQEEVLVRASGLPPAEPKAELLRTVPHGVDTPAAELLRATTTTEGGN